MNGSHLHTNGSDTPEGTRRLFHLSRGWILTDEFHFQLSILWLILHISISPRYSWVCPLLEAAGTWASQSKLSTTPPAVHFFYYFFFFSSHDHPNFLGNVRMPQMWLQPLSVAGSPGLMMKLPKGIMTSQMVSLTDVHPHLIPPNAQSGQVKKKKKKESRLRCTQTR